MSCWLQCFKLNAESKEALLEAFQNNPDILRDLDNAVSQCEARETRMIALMERKKALEKQNHALRVELTGIPHAHAAVRDEFDESTPGTGNPVKESWREVPYYYEGPAVKGEVSTALAEGRLFRIVKGNELYFYNDSCYYRMHIQYSFSKGSNVVLGSSSQWTKRLSAEMGEATLILDPLETGLLCTGRFTQLNNESKAEAITQVTEKESVFRGEMNDTMKSNLEEVMSMCPSWMTEEKYFIENGALINERAVEECLKQLHPFVDIIFPPNRNSLFREGCDRFYIPPLVWKRPKEFLPSGADIRLFHGPLRLLYPGDDGVFPNRHFTSLLHVLIERNENGIKELFRHPESAKKGKLERLLGIGRVLLCVSGWWRSVVVDSYVPSTFSRPMFTNNPFDLRDTWPCILEKAIAKSCGSYSAMIDCSAQRCCTMLTGFPSSSLESVWPTLKDCTRFSEFFRSLRPKKKFNIFFETFSVGEACKRRGLPSLYEKFGFVAGQTVMCSGDEVVDGVTLLHLRPTQEQSKPCEDWLSVWRDEEKKWVTKVGELVLGLNSTNMVWMDITDIPRFFSGGFVAYDISECDEVRIKGKFSANGAPSAVMKIRVTSSLPIAISLTQTSPQRSVGLGLYSSNEKSNKSGAAHGVPIIHSITGKGGSETYYSCEEVLLTYTLQPEGSPYFVVPEAIGARDTSSWTLGLFTGCDTLNSMEISFLSVSQDMRFLDTSLQHALNGLKLTENTDTEFQVRRSSKRIVFNKKHHIF